MTKLNIECAKNIKGAFFVNIIDALTNFHLGEFKEPKVTFNETDIYKDVYGEKTDEEVVDTIQKLINECFQKNEQLLHGYGRQLTEEEWENIQHNQAVLKKLSDWIKGEEPLGDEQISRYTKIKREFLHESDKELRKVFKEIEKQLAKRKVSCERLGQYNYVDNEIILFLKVINMQQDPETTLVMTLAHEMFHAFHYFNSQFTFADSCGEAKAVKEALADYFAVYYLESRWNNKFRNLADERRRSWERNLYFDWPYANAYFIEHSDFDGNSVSHFGYNEGVPEKFYKVFDKSQSDMVKAYKLLVPKDWQRKFNNKSNRAKEKKARAESVQYAARELIKRWSYDGDITCIEDINKKYGHMLTVKPGKFVMLESGEIISFEQQVEIKDEEELMRETGRYGIKPIVSQDPWILY